MDSVLFPANFFDYPDDEVAIQREVEIGESIDAGTLYTDDIFPPNARSLYFDPLNPPKGSIPNECIKWFRISEGDLLGCENPIILQDSPLTNSSEIMQGALGDKYLLSALSLLACDSKYIKRLIVSNKYAAKGLYTLKFYKNGKWRYIHIDDYIPCRQSGKIHFSYNKNPNELFAMLIEKAYAKLHGCYEALSFGLIENIIKELTPGAGCEALRIERYHRRTLCDEIWEKMEKSLKKGSLIGCQRFITDSFAENPAIRQGITLG
jgi:calpain